MPTVGISSRIWILFHRGFSRKLVEDTGRLSLEGDNLLAAKLMLNFLAILWHSNTRGCIHRQTVSPFLSLLVERLSSEHPDSLPSLMLRDSLLTTLATMEVLRADPTFGEINKFWEDETICRIAMESGLPDLFVSCEFTTLKPWFVEINHPV